MNIRYKMSEEVNRSNATIEEVRTKTSQENIKQLSKETRRGYVAKDEKEFKGKAVEILRKAGEELVFLLDRGYPIKPATTFIGNHYMLSERQRLALARGYASSSDCQLRKKKEVTLREAEGQVVHIDGFNTIITLEVALSGSLLLLCKDGLIRDLAGLRGTYRIIDKTKEAIWVLLTRLKEARVASAVFYLDAPVSNSGRLKTLIGSLAEECRLETEIFVMNEVDRTLQKKSFVVTSDAIVLNQCHSFINLNRELIGTHDFLVELGE